MSKKLYNVALSRDAAKMLVKLKDKRLKHLIESALADLALEPRPDGSLKIKDGNLEHCEGTTYRVRLPDKMRCLYAVIDIRSEVYVIRIEHRNEIYKKH